MTTKKERKNALVWYRLPLISAAFVLCLLSFRNFSLSPTLSSFTTTDTLLQQRVTSASSYSRQWHFQRTSSDEEEEEDDDEENEISKIEDEEHVESQFGLLSSSQEDGSKKTSSDKTVGKREVVDSAALRTAAPTTKGDVRYDEQPAEASQQTTSTTSGNTNTKEDGQNFDVEEKQRSVAASIAKDFGLEGEPDVLLKVQKRKGLTTGRRSSGTMNAANLKEQTLLTMQQEEQQSRMAKQQQPADSARTDDKSSTDQQQQHKKKRKSHNQMRSVDHSDWRQYKNRTIAIVHVGKAGGITLRKHTALACPANNFEKCMKRRFSPNATLSRQVYFPLHMHDIPRGKMKNSTSFLVLLRNPIDRIVSTYRYSHPANCNQFWRTLRGVKPYGCYLEKWFNDSQLDPEYRVYETYATCFPSPAMEDFAQSVMTPYPQNLTISSPKCRGLAYEFVRGTGPRRPAPHMAYNYAHYLQSTVRKFPQHEVFAIRTEHEFTDMYALDVAIGGDGKTFAEARQKGVESHGSERYAPSPLSSEAYGKLCCVLEREILHYDTFLSLALNINETDRQESMNQVRTKCGIETSWEMWREQCRQRLRKDHLQEELKDRLRLGRQPAIPKPQQQSK